jgi:putative heme-binding domain-containing protein
MLAVRTLHPADGRDQMNLDRLPSVRSLIRSLLTGLGALALLVAGAPAPALGQGDADHTYSSAAIEAGSRVYVTECALCHAPNGDGVDGVDLRLGLFRGARSDDDLRRVITTGVSDSRMPAFALRPEELDGVVAYIRAGFDPEGVAVRVGDAASGQAIFQGAGRCVQCHRVNGVGRRLAPDLSDVGLVRTPAAIQRTILDPTAALLPINRPVRAVTRDGETIRGRRLNEDTYTVQLIDSQERLRSLVKADLVEYEVSRTATMEPTTLSADEVADLIGYLLSLRGLP